jgi:thiol:disulfide interchange protein DsbC
MADTESHREAVPEMLARLRKAYPATQFDAVRSSEIPGLFEVSMGHNVAYVEPNGRYFLFGHLYDLPANDDITARRQSDLVSVKTSTLPASDGLVIRRSEKPAHKLAVFSDPNCGYCRALEKTLASLPDIEVTVYLLPLQDGSEEAAANVWCAPDRQAAWESLMQKNKPIARHAKCDTSVFARNRALATQLGIHGTPALIADDGRMQPGFLNRPELLAWLTRSSTIMEPIRK